VRIALFTPFSPVSGASSVPLRAHLEQMTDLDIRWYYLAKETVDRPCSQRVGTPLSDVQLALDLSARTGVLPGSTAAVRRIADQLEGDLFWILGHYEGVSVAAELLKQGRPVHLTVHDDPIGMFQRSRRYRALTPLMAGLFAKVIRAAKSVDVISKNLRDAYLSRYNVKSFVVYRYVPELPKFPARPTEDSLTIGHIGSLYHAQPFRQFLQACRDYTAAKNRKLKILRIGTSPELDSVAAENPDVFRHAGELDEKEAIARLAQCDFVYAMYPDGKRFERFRRTSMPMKFSTYIQAQRPIFAHTPLDSGLAEFVDRSQVGVVCRSVRPGDIHDCIDKLLQRDISARNFEQLRSELMGREQIEQLRHALSGQPPSSGS
jgi:hypothetical protein